MHWGWFGKGQPTRAPQPAKRQPATVFGALPLRTQRFYWQRAERGTAKVLIELWYPLHPRFPESVLVLILDNATLHTGRVVKPFLRRHAGVEFEPLAPYSPAYKPMERFWHWLQAKVYGASTFATMAAVSARIRQWIWHDHEGWLTTSIHFDVAPYTEIL